MPDCGKVKLVASVIHATLLAIVSTRRWIVQFIALAVLVIIAWFASYWLNTLIITVAVVFLIVTDSHHQLTILGLVVFFMEPQKWDMILISSVAAIVLTVTTVCHGYQVYLKKRSFYYLINHAIKIFKKQRIQGCDDFAVLFLLSDDENYSQMRFATQRRVVHYDSNLATNYTKPSFPLRNNLHNYVTAHPIFVKDDGNQYSVHAEELLLGKLEALMSSYAEREPPCMTIVLYTWFLPCEICKQKIVKKLKHLVSEERQVILAYSCTTADVTTEMKREMIKDIQSTGISVEKVPYAECDLPAN